MRFGDGKGGALTDYAQGIRKCRCYSAFAQPGKMHATNRQVGCPSKSRCRPIAWTSVICALPKLASAWFYAHWKAHPSGTANSPCAGRRRAPALWIRIARSLPSVRVAKALASMPLPSTRSPLLASGHKLEATSCALTAPPKASPPVPTVNPCVPPAATGLA